MVKKIKYITILALIYFTLSSFNYNNGGRIKTIVIDAGHGGKDPGCHGAKNLEKDVSLGVALKLGKLIENNLKDVKVIYTRTSDIFVELEDRAQIANKAKADLFISIHCNAAGKPVYVINKKTRKKQKKMYKNKKGKMVPVEQTNPEPFGTETYVMGLKNEEGKMKVAQRENSAIFYEDDYEKKYDGFDPDSPESYIIMSNYTSAYVLQSATLALKIQEEYTKKAGRIDKGVHRQSIWVLWRTAMPSILTEIGYLTNPLEEEFLASENGQDYLAKAIYRGLRRYKDEVEGTKKTYNDDIENQIPLENENVKAGNLPGLRKKMSDDDVDDDDDDDEKEGPEIKKNKNTQQPKDSVKEKEDKQITQNSTLKVFDSTAKNSVKSVKEDTLNAKTIIEKFKQENQKKSEKINSAGKITYCVQFLSSDKERKFTDKKYAALINPQYYKQGDQLKYFSGQFNTMSEAATHQAALRSSGMSDCFVIIMYNGKRISQDEAKKMNP
ncbi:MAG: N-acetylmuramoyl-L-alanine amidase [Bacteroidetes bacterium]|nr:N-acetylmuramoyl-L-alanine amidase [Bacteroidota bacterium]